MSLLKQVKAAGPVALLMVLGAAGAASAYTSASPDPFAVGNRLVGSDACVSGGPFDGLCTYNNETTFLTSSLSFPGDGNEHVTTNAILAGDLSMGLGPYALTGATDFIVTGRTSPTELGTFPLEESYVDLTGIVLGHDLELVLDSSMPSTGFVTISGGGPCSSCTPVYQIDVTLDVNDLLIVDGGTPVPVGSSVTGAGAVPEPASWAMMLLGLGAIGGALRRRHATA